MYYMGWDFLWINPIRTNLVYFAESFCIQVRISSNAFLALLKSDLYLLSISFLSLRIALTNGFLRFSIALLLSGLQVKELTCRVREGSGQPNNRPRR